MWMWMWAVDDGDVDVEREEEALVDQVLPGSGDLLLPR